MVKTKMSFVDGLIGFLTLGIYTPLSTSVYTCPEYRERPAYINNEQNNNRRNDNIFEKQPEFIEKSPYTPIPNRR